LNDDIKDALDDARYRRHIFPCGEADDDEDLGYCLVEFNAAGFICWSRPERAEDDTGLEVDRDRHGRLVVKKNGKVVYVEGLHDERRRTHDQR